MEISVTQICSLCVSEFIAYCTHHTMKRERTFVALQQHTPRHSRYTFLHFVTNRECYKTINSEVCWNVKVHATCVILLRCRLIPLISDVAHISSSCLGHSYRLSTYVFTRGLWNYLSCLTSISLKSCIEWVIMETNIVR